MTGVAAYLAVVLAVAALACGHQGADWPLTKPWRAVKAAWARRARQEPAGAPQGPSRLPRGLRGAPEPAQSRSARPAPSWAHEQPTTYEEAA